MAVCKSNALPAVLLLQLPSHFEVTVGSDLTQLQVGPRKVGTGSPGWGWGIITQWWFCPLSDGRTHQCWKRNWKLGPACKPCAQGSEPARGTASSVSSNFPASHLRGLAREVWGGGSPNLIRDLRPGSCVSSTWSCPLGVRSGDLPISQLPPSLSQGDGECADPIPCVLT